MDLPKWFLYTLGALFGAACVAHIVQTVKGSQVVNIVIPEGHDVHINEPKTTFELDTTTTAGPVQNVPV